MGHPLQLPLAIAIARYAPPRIACRLVISRHKYWSYIDRTELRRDFADVCFFEPIYHAHTLKALVRVLRRISAVKKEMVSLPVKPDDVIVSLEVWNYIENIFTTVHRKNKQVFLCPEGIYSFVSLAPATIGEKGFYICKSGWIHHLLVEPLMRLKKRTYVYWPRIKGKNGEWGICYSKKVETLYDTVRVLKSLFTPTLKENEMYYPYQTLRTAHDAPQRKMIVFMLSGFVTDKEYNTRVSAILQNLRSLYAAEYELHLRLHPNRPTGDAYVATQGWIINREPGNVEQFLIRHAGSIARVFSDKSTAQIFALNIGIPCYSYHRLLGLEEIVTQYHDATFASAPKEFFMDSLTQTPQPYEPVAHGLQKSQNSLEKLYAIISSH
ncbi:MAG: hypothetical protein UY44_C0005G0025 [Candidatus Kaiserbacteria bacterium GW2011_GWA2_49_19]|uniref:Uncharacterized protein n=1 Tax=Candidatus Kaiserbacteria bacterium GW2011_GWA2_49_19 TaxID=1618669 RepID=A0A0G1VRK8_9BACT|nr:MAG: hypothetical protein UY44_C0005G0025 [Candidatus Kaiserbacteria bacterium GW2011_GWA2_49_19]